MTPRIADALSPVRAALIAFALALAAGLAGVFTLPTLDRDEARFAQATAQMLESGDYVQIRFLDTQRHKKPVGIHWLQAISVGALSDAAAREIWAYRLPSALGAALAAAFTALAAARLYGASAGLAAGSLFGVSILLGAEAGIAKTDAMLAAAAAACLYAYVRLRMGGDLPDPDARRRAGRVWSVALWAAMGAGALIKGPVAPMTAGLAVTALVALERRWNWARPLAWWPGPLVAALIVLPWLVAVQLATDGGFLREALGEDLGPKLVSGHESHGAPPGVHLALLPLLVFPAIAFLPAGLRAAISDWRAGPDPAARSAALAAKMLLAFALPTWLVFEFLPTKLPHYVLPAYPALAALAGLGLVRLTETPALWRWLGAGLIVAAALAGAIGLRLAPGWFGGPTDLALALSVIFLLTASVAAVTTVRRRTPLALAAAIVTGLTFHVAARGIVLPRSEALFVSERAAEAVARVAAFAPGAQLVSSYTEPSFVFAMGGALTLSDPATLTANPPDPAQPALLALDLTRWLEGAETDGEFEARQAALEALIRASCDAESVDGFNYSRGDPISVLVLALHCPADPESPS